VKILLDENLPHELRHFLPRHDVSTTAFMGWAGVKNGELLRRAAADGFDVLITADRGMEYEQNVGSLPVAVLQLKAGGTKMVDLMPLVPEMLDALFTLKPRTFVRLPQ
jgi:predicted nuclease of predicted toxin-antitoxin system